MSKKKQKDLGGLGSIDGILGGFTDLVEKLTGLAEKGEEFARREEFQWQGGKGVFGFSVKTGIGGDDVKVEPFGNIRRDEKSGHAVVQEIREPVVDIFEEEDHTVVIAEIPGVSVEDVQVDLRDDLLTIYAERGPKKYRKEVLLPRPYVREKIEISCNNGMLEIKCRD